MRADVERHFNLWNMGARKLSLSEIYSCQCRRISYWSMILLVVAILNISKITCTLFLTFLVFATTENYEVYAWPPF